MEITEDMRAWLEKQREYHTQELQNYAGKKLRAIRDISRRGKTLRTIRKKEKETQHVLDGLNKFLNCADWEV